MEAQKAFIDYVTKANPRGIMRLAYQRGELPYSYQEPVQDYLKRIASNIIVDIGFDEFKSQTEPFKTEPQDEAKPQEKLIVLPQSPEAQRRAIRRKKAVKKDTFFNFFGNSNQNQPQDEGQQIAIWLAATVLIIMVAFFFMSVLTKKGG
jgi:hypothetical protein